MNMSERLAEIEQRCDAATPGPWRRGVDETNWWLICSPREPGEPYNYIGPDWEQMR